MDSCAIIDFVRADTGIIGLICEYIGDIYVLKQIVSELSATIEANELIDLGLRIIEPKLEDILSISRYTQKNFPSKINYAL
jgi:hypothetical protein